MNLNAKVPKVNAMLVIVLGLFIEASYFLINATLQWGFGTYHCITAGPIPNYCGMLGYLAGQFILQNLLFLYPTIFSMAFSYFLLVIWKMMRTPEQST